MWGIVDMRAIVVMILQELETAQTRTQVPQHLIPPEVTVTEMYL